MRTGNILAISACLALTSAAFAPAMAESGDASCSTGLKAVKSIALPPDQLDYALVTLETQTYPALEREIGAMRDMGVYVKFVFPPNAAIVGIPPRWHPVETEFYQAAQERQWRVIRDLVDERVLSASTGVREDVFSLWNINYMGAGVLYGIRPVAPLRWGGEKHEKSLERFRERRRKGFERSIAERAHGSSADLLDASLASPQASAAIGDLVEGPPCGSVAHGSTGIRYDPIEYALGSWVISLVTPETPPDGVGGVTTNAEEQWNDNPSDELLQVKSMVMTATNDMIDGFTGGLTIGNMSVVFNFEDQVRTCCGQGKSDADCNFRCHEPIATASTVESQYITDLTFPLGINTTPIEFGPYYPHFNYIFEYNDQKRNQFNTNWAHMIFAIDSTNDADNLFEDGYYGWNYLATGFQTSVTGVYTYGFEAFSQLAQHETSHGPGTLDEYKFGGSRCNHRGGYLNVRNRNSIDGGGGCEGPVACVMKDAFPIVDTCYWTRGQAGGWDSDSDGIPDILDTTPTCTVSDTGGGNFSGSGSVNPLANQNPNSYVSPVGYTSYGLTNANGLTLNTVIDVQYSVDGGPLQPATPADGGFDGCSEDFGFVASGTTIDVVVTNSVGNTGTCQAGGGGGTCDNDGVCEPGEDCETCSNDCDGVTKGKPANRFCCGNGEMEPPEGDGAICDGNF
jgi:hypothetical protein